MSSDLSIRPFQIDDVPALYEAVRESIDDLRPWMPWCHSGYAMSETQEWVEKQIAAFEALHEFHFAILFGNRHVVGACGLNGIQSANRLANLGYWVRSSASRRGFATQSTRLLAQWAFQNTDLERLEILVSIRNRGSLRVAAKAGAVWEGVLRGRLRLHGELHDAVLFSILRDDG
ncbi:MAG TPA: GNAT family N-acetyltransferase [Terriglobia bacterium]|nr:GNAT family N-acetyltransferase [Terriglobia bacterium]